jgi:hypothetical protein
MSGSTSGGYRVCAPEQPRSIGSPWWPAGRNAMLLLALFMLPQPLPMRVKHLPAGRLLCLRR